MSNVVMDRPFTAASFNQFIIEKRLMGSRCVQCETLFLPPRAICPKCHSEQLAWVEMSGRGKLAAFTSVYIAPTYMINAGYGRDNPYVSGVVEFDEGVKISARILGVDPKNPASIKIGTPLNAVFVEEGEAEEKRTTLAFKAKTHP